LHTAQLNRCEAILLGEIQNLEPFPGRASESRKADRQTLAGGASDLWQCRKKDCQALKKIPSC